MTTILIVEPDDAVRGDLLHVLAFQGFETLSAADGGSGLAQCRAFLPQVVVCAAQLPDMDRHGLLRAIRADRWLAPTPVIILAVPGDPESALCALAAGANDCISPPFSASLLDSVNTQLRKRNQHASAVASKEGAAVSPGQPLVEPLANSTVLFSQVRNFAPIAAKLQTDDVALALDHYFATACQILLEKGARHIHLVGQGLMAVFTDESTGVALTAAQRAVSAALSMALEAHEFRRWLRQRFPGRRLPPLALCSGIDAGDVMLCQVGATRDSETVLMGEAVSTAVRLESAGREMGWTVVISPGVLTASENHLKTGVRSRLLLPAMNTSPAIEAIEITGFEDPQQADADADGARDGAVDFEGREQALAEAIRFNSELTARTAKGALDATLSALADPGFDAAGESIHLKGYHVVRKLASGGMSEVYLAERESDDMPVVLKVLDLQVRRHADNLTRFIHEYALLSAISHPNVIRIYDQGFTDAYAYIGMEYFSAGDLRTLMQSSALTQQRTLEVIRDIAAALAAIHAMNIVHCDIKPENIMLREDGSAALADFGIARQLRGPSAHRQDVDDAPDMIGTPYYLSPEQAAGFAATTQSDLYSLGVMMFEMLAGRRPFNAESLELLRARHRESPTPTLPAAHRRLQTIVNRLMEKRVQNRYATAESLLEDLTQSME